MRFAPTTLEINTTYGSDKYFIGFTDFEEGSKSEIFRRCDIGASNENEKYSGRDAGGIQSNSGELSSKEFECLSSHILAASRESVHNINHKHT